MSEPAEVPRLRWRYNTKRQVWNIRLPECEYGTVLSRWQRGQASYAWLYEIYRQLRFVTADLPRWPATPETEFVRRNNLA